MSRVIVVDHCTNCPDNSRNWYETDVYGEWCGLKRRAISVPGDYPFPARCPLPESGEKEESK